jgi:hypothetical protein
MSATLTKTATAPLSETTSELIRTDSSLGQIKEKPAYRIALVCLLSVWAAFCLATVILIIAMILPGHLGLSDWLQALSNLLPANFPISTT